MSIQIVATDSKLHFRPSVTGHPFRGLIGISLGISDPDDFRKRHEDMFSSFFIDNNVTPNRLIYKASEIARLFPGEPYEIRGILRKLVNQIFQFPEVVVNVYFLTLNLKLLRDKKVKDFEDSDKEINLEQLIEQSTEAEIIQMYGNPGEDELVYISVKELFEKVSQYFPVICSSQLCKFASLRKCTFVLDGCSGYETKALRDLTSSDNTILIAPHGDEYDPFINTSDIIVRWLDEELKQSHFPMNFSGVDSILHNWRGITDEIDTKHIKLVHLSNKDLDQIKPISRKTMGYFENIYRKHPVYYIFQESKEEDERERLVNSPAMDVIINRVYQKNGSYCFWKTKNHSRYVAKGDIAVVYGDNGLKEARKLIDMLYPITIWDIRE